MVPVFRNLSIPQKLTWVVMLASSVALLSASVAFLAYDVFSFRKGMVHRFSKDAEIVGFNSVAALLFEDREAAADTLGGLKADSDVISAALYDREGRLFATYQRLGAAEPARLPPSADPSGHRFGTDGLLLTRSIDLEGKPVGSVFIQASLAEMGRRIRGYTGIVLVVCLGSVIAALAISSHFQKAISQPILHLADTARVVSTNQDYSVRATHAGDDELGLLVRTFNAMLSQIERQDGALRESEQHFRELADAMPQIVWTARPDGGANYYNKRWFDYTELSAEQSAGLGWQAVLHPDDLAPCLERWGRATDTGEDWAVECRLRRHDGAYRWHLGRAVAVRDDRERIGRWFGTWTDIDDQKRTAETLAQQAQELARSNAELEQFAYVASHDLQEPLRGVAGCAQLLERRYKGALDEQAQELIRHTVEGATRMQALITDLLSYSRVGTRGNPFVPTECDATLEGALYNLRVSIEEAGARITAGELPTVTADATQITQLLQNLIGNAIKFRGEDAPRIHVGAERQGDGWLFSVRDNGIGIDPSYFERIFGMFQRLHTRTEYPGTGIGLAICKKIVERHGGSIRLESEPGRGSTFYFTIPSEGVSCHENEARVETH